MSSIKSTAATLQTITPYLSVKNAEAAIQFYQRVFGAREIGRLTMGGAIGHAELQIGNSTIMLAEENAEWGNKSPTTLGGTSVTIALLVDNVDATYKLALESGAREFMPLKDEFYGGRVGVFHDPFGHRWHVMTQTEDVSFDEMQKRVDAMMAAGR